MCQGKDGDDGAADGLAATTQEPARRRFATLGKDPTVRSDFLPDKDRDRDEQELREQLKREWELQQVGMRAAHRGWMCICGLPDCLCHPVPLT